MKLLTVVTEGILEERLLRDLRELGAVSASAGEVRTSARRGQQEWEYHHIRVEALFDPASAARAMALLERSYLRHYELHAWVVDAQALAPDA